jgi:hypothetical protein
MHTATFNAWADRFPDVEAATLCVCGFIERHFHTLGGVLAADPTSHLRLYMTVTADGERPEVSLPSMVMNLLGRARCAIDIDFYGSSVHVVDDGDDVHRG